MDLFNMIISRVHALHVDKLVNQFGFFVSFVIIFAIYLRKYELENCDNFIRLFVI